MTYWLVSTATVFNKLHKTVLVEIANGQCWRRIVRMVLPLSNIPSPSDFNSDGMEEKNGNRKK